MKLDIEKIKEITTGASVIKEEDSYICLNRFTEEQERLYKSVSEEFYVKSFSTAGVKFSFRTDSKSLFIKIRTSPFSPRRYFSVDVFADGNPVGFIDNFSDTELLRDYTNSDYPLGDFSKTFEFVDGIKEVRVHLPWSMITVIEEISIDDGAFIEGIKPKKKLLAFGDSITHGYDALRPSNRYIARLSDLLCAEEFNKAIGGERFFPELAKLKEDFIPDYITVAYGTNDWFHVDEETFKQNCAAFYLNLASNYRNSKIFAITPIWRKDMNEKRIFGDFRNVERDIREAVAGIDNITVISGFDFVPKDEDYFADLRLHPNDAGFEHYAKNLFDKIKPYI